ncbi:TetR/AcrR family transcriptional regulator [Nocardia stercoris]|uniref:TetR family transcriptional regulator n=1 Tax=Nocardia stercoris TaxID=2483361 RepID=A0A3M2KYM5_9NOCA|nr:TetR family transcriptional regulator [Nocardia stercoris]RMI30391.1 TetR family transcriptional regulator [Nocardia stercoris]
MTVEVGLRERKKQQTRAKIMDAALNLFAARGFDDVRVSEIARLAEVSEATIFNYFPTKEDLVYQGMGTYEDALIAAIRDRPTGTPILTAAREFVVQRRGALATADPAALARVATMARLIAGSAALRTREQQIIDRATTELAQLIAAEQVPEVLAYTSANALLGISRALTREVHRLALAGRTGADIAAHMLAEGARAFDLLEDGLGEFAPGR